MHPSRQFRAAPPTLKEVGRGHPVLLVHDLGFDSRQWGLQIAPFGRRYTGLRVEWNYTRIEVDGGWPEQFMSLRGTAFVGIPPELRYVDPAGDLLALMDRGGIPSAHFVISRDTFGDPLIELALKHPDRVRSLTVVAWTPGIFTHAAAGDSEYVRALTAQIEEYQELIAHGDVDRFVNSLVETGTFAVSDDIGRHYAREMLLDNLATFSPPMVQVRQPETPVHEKLADVSRPTLAVIGQQARPWQKDASEYLASQVPDGRTALVPDARPYPNLDNPRGFNEQVLSFLADVDAQDDDTLEE